MRRAQIWYRTNQVQPNQTLPPSQLIATCLATNKHRRKHARRHGTIVEREYRETSTRTPETTATQLTQHMLLCPQHATRIHLNPPVTCNSRGPGLLGVIPGICIVCIHSQVHPSMPNTPQIAQQHTPRQMRQHCSTCSHHSLSSKCRQQCSTCSRSPLPRTRCPQCLCRQPGQRAAHHRAAQQPQPLAHLPALQLHYFASYQVSAMFASTARSTRSGLPT
jgi:hypothetical protein